MKKTIVFLLTLALSLSIMGCSASKAEKEVPAEQQEAASETEEKLDIGYSLIDLANPYFVALSQGVKDTCKEQNINVTIHDAKTDITSQISAVENFIAQKKDMILISPVDEVAMEPVVEKAHEAGIPVIAMNINIEGRDAFITPNEYQYGETGGKIAGEWIKANMENEADAKVVVMTCPEQPTLANRIKGLKEGVLKIAPGAEVIAEQSANTPEEGMSAAEIILQSHPDANVVVCNNDASALGAYEAFVAAGVEKACIVGLDATEEAVNKINEGGIFVGTVDIDPYGTGKLAVDTVLEVLEKGVIDEPIEIPMIPVTQENIDQYIK